MLGWPCEYKFGFHPNMSVQAIFKLLPIIFRQNLGNLFYCTANNLAALDLKLLIYDN